MKHRLSFLLTFLLILSSHWGYAKSKWKTFSSEVGKFSILAPGDFSENKKTLQTQIGPVDLTMYTLQETEEQIVFLVGFSDYPAHLVKESDANKVLDGAKKGQLESLQGKVISEKPIQIKQHPGKEVLISGMNDTLHVALRLFLVENRLYQVMVAAPKEKEKTKSIPKFLESFSLL